MPRQASTDRISSEARIEPPEPARLRLSPAELETYAGSYDAALDRVDVSVGGERLKLTFTPKRGFPRPDSPLPPAPPPVPAAFFARDRIMGVGGRRAGHRGEFLRDAEGRIVWLRWHGRIHAHDPTEWRNNRYSLLQRVFR